MPRSDRDESIDRWLGGAGTPDDVRQFAEGVRADPDLRHELGEQAAIDALLRASRRPSVAEQVMIRLPPGLPPRRTSSFRGLAWLVVLALTAVAVVAVMLSLRTPATDAAVTPPPVAEAVPPTEAKRLIVLSAVADSSVDEARPELSSGASVDLPVLGRAAGQRIAFIRFHLPPGRIQRAVLVLTAESGHGDVLVHLVAPHAVGSWDEATLRWWHMPDIGPAVGALRAIGSRWELELGDLRGPVVDLALTTAATTPTIWCSRETGQHGPRLELTLRTAPE